MSTNHPNSSSKARRKGVESLEVWWKARGLVVLVYEQVRELPPVERYGLSDQLRRAAISIVANISEGHGRLGRAEYRHFVSIALGSLIELKALLLVCSDLKLRTPEEVAPVLAEVERVGQMLTKLAAALRG